MVRHTFVGLVCVIGFVSSSSAGQLQMSTACEGNGISGTYSENGTTVQFQSCLEAGTLHAFVKTQVGDPVAEMYAAPNNQLTVIIGGVALTESNSQSELNLIQAAINSAAAATASTIPVALKAVGFDGTEPVLRAMVALGVVFENIGGAGDSAGCLSGPKCVGCCGKGCVGCMGICTVQCAQHDECVGRAGYLACAGLLKDAMLSALGCCMCQGEGCTCCWGAGPGC